MQEILFEAVALAGRAMRLAWSDLGLVDGRTAFLIGAATCYAMTRVMFFFVGYAARMALAVLVGSAAIGAVGLVGHPAPPPSTGTQPAYLPAPDGSGAHPPAMPYASSSQRWTR